MLPARRSYGRGTRECGAAFSSRRARSEPGGTRLALCGTPTNRSRSAASAGPAPLRPVPRLARIVRPAPMPGFELAVPTVSSDAASATTTSSPTHTRIKPGLSGTSFALPAILIPGTFGSSFPDAASSGRPMALFAARVPCIVSMQRVDAVVVEPHGERDRRGRPA